MPRERWKKIIEFDVFVSDRGGLRKISTGQPVTVNTNGHGYSTAWVGEEQRTVADLVLLAWRGPKPEGLESLHGNDNGEDNRLSNLRYGTREENRKDRARNERKRLRPWTRLTKVDGASYCDETAHYRSEG